MFFLYFKPLKISENNILPYLLVKSDRSSKFIVLNLSKNVLTSIVTSSGEENDNVFDLDTPRPSVSNEHRPSVFQYLPKFIGTADHSFEEADHNKSLSLPAHLQKRDNIAKQLSKSAKRRISQIFWENDLGRRGSHRNSLTSSHSCFRGCCLSFRGRQNSLSAYSVPVDKCMNGEFGRQDEDRSPNSNDRTSSKINLKGGRQRRRSKSVGESNSLSGFVPSRKRLPRVNSLPGGYMKESNGDRVSTQDFMVSPQCSTRPNLVNPESDARMQTMPKIIVTVTHDENETRGLLDKCSVINPGFEGQESCGTDERELFVERPPVRPILERRALSSIPSLSSARTSKNDKGGEHFERARHSSDRSPEENGPRVKEMVGTSTASSEGIRRSVSDHDLMNKARKIGRVHFAY